MIGVALYISKIISSSGCSIDGDSLLVACGTFVVLGLIQSQISLLTNQYPIFIIECITECIKIIFPDLSCILANLIPARHLMIL